MKYLFIGLLKFYKLFISPFLGNNCRFTPSCSNYATQCFEKYPIPRASVLSFKRICKCHPFHEGGDDPVP